MEVQNATDLDVFIFWLKEQGIYDQWRSGRELNPNPYPLKDELMAELIDRSFLWSDTKEKHNFWSDYNTRWQSPDEIERAKVAFLKLRESLEMDKTLFIFE